VSVVWIVVIVVVATAGAMFGLGYLCGAWRAMRIYEDRQAQREEDDMIRTAHEWGYSTDDDQEGKSA
jgi:hypothetical protein